MTNTPELNDQVNANEIAARVGTQLIKDFWNSIRNPLAKALSKQLVSYMESFSSYLEQSHAKCDSIRVLIDKDRVYRLDEVYVGAKYKVGRKIISDDEIISLCRDGANGVIVGFGGIGKTVFMKHAFESILKSPEGKIPVFIELKRLNEIATVNIISYVRATLTGGRPEFTDEHFDVVSAAGRFIFLFDGFDEVVDESRDRIESEILKISYKYPKCSVVVSSRSDKRFHSWDGFTIFNAQPFTKKQVEEAIRKIDFDPPVKKKFLDNIIKKKYETFQSFLSTPLLALMMLMTYRQFAEVPEKVHIFYRYAFQTLYSLHDSAKESFRRQRKTNLDEDGFSKVFSFTCLLSYIAMRSSFDDKSLKALVDAAKTRANVVVNTEKFIEEAIESVNLLFRDGDEISFVHRSFQEYFSAYCIVNYMSDRLVDVVDRLPSSLDEATLMMAYQMNQDVMEERYILPKYAESKNFIRDLSAVSTISIDTMSRLKMKWLIWTGPDGRIANIYVYSGATALNLLSRVSQMQSREEVPRFMYPSNVSVEGRFAAALASIVQGSFPGRLEVESRATIFVDFATGHMTCDDTKGEFVDVSFEGYENFAGVAVSYPEGVLKVVNGWKVALAELEQFMKGVRSRNKKREDTFDNLSRIFD